MCNDSVRCQWGITLVRIVLGVIFILHGGQKVVGWLGGPGLGGFVTWAAGYGISSPIAYLAAFAEFIGGWLLLLGFFAELGALMTMGVMLGAIFIIHWPHGFFVQHGGYEYPLVLSLLDAAILISGPGRLAIKSFCSNSCKF